MLFNFFSTNGSMLNNNESEKNNGSIKIENKSSNPENDVNLDSSEVEKLINKNKQRVKNSRKNKNDSTLTYAVGIPLGVGALALSCYLIYRLCKTKGDPKVEKNFKDLLKNIRAYSWDGNKAELAPLHQDAKKMISFLNDYLLDLDEPFNASGFDLSTNNKTYAAITKWLINQGYKKSTDISDNIVNYCNSAGLGEVYVKEGEGSKQAFRIQKVRLGDLNGLRFGPLASKDLTVFLLSFCTGKEEISIANVPVSTGWGIEIKDRQGMDASRLILYKGVYKGISKEGKVEFRHMVAPNNNKNDLNKPKTNM